MLEPSSDVPTAPVQGRVSSQALDRSLVHGLAWTSAAKWGTQLLSWASTLIVARLLTPEDYGLVGMASIYLGLVTLLSEFGLGATVMALRDLTEEQVAQLQGFAVLFGVAGFAVSCLAAWPLGAFFHSAELPPVVIVMSVAFIITSFRIVPGALLQRELRFRDLALIDAASALVLAVAMVAFAWFGFRYWTLVIGGLLSSSLSTIQTLWLRRERLAWPRMTTLDAAMTFSRHILTSRLSWYGYSNADFLVAGRLLGKAALGVYNFAWNLANVPIEKITVLIGQVAFPIFAAVQAEPAEIRRYLLRLTEGLALLTFPASFGLALVAPDFIHLFLGPKWSDAILPLQLLAVFVGFRSVAPLLSTILNVIGESRFAMYNSLLSALILPISFVVMGHRWGTAGLALAWMTIYPPLAFLLYRRVAQRIELPASHYLRALWPAVSSTAVMCAAVMGVQPLTAEFSSRALRLGLQIAIGALVYSAMCGTMHRHRVLAAYDIVKRQRRGRGISPPAS